jgi:hypothetical protein
MVRPQRSGAKLRRPARCSVVERVDRKTPAQAEAHHARVWHLVGVDLAQAPQSRMVNHSVEWRRLHDEWTFLATAPIVILT